MEFIECLNEDVKKGHFVNIRGRAILIATVPTCLMLSMSFINSMMI